MILQKNFCIFTKNLYSFRVFRNIPYSLLKFRFIESCGYSIFSFLIVAAYYSTF